MEGPQESHAYQDEEGKERGVCEIVAGDVGFLSRRPSGDGVADTIGASKSTDDVAPVDIPF